MLVRYCLLYDTNLFALSFGANTFECLTNKTVVLQNLRNQRSSGTQIGELLDSQMMTSKNAVSVLKETWS